MRAAIAPLLLSALLGSALACAGDPARYRLGDRGADWASPAGDPLVAELRPRYPSYFAQLLDRDRTADLDLLPLRDDLESLPASEVNYHALNAIALGYFELNQRAQSEIGGSAYFADSFRAAKLLAVPWRAYGEVEQPALRDAILSFFEDAGVGSKPETTATAPRLTRIVESLVAKEADPTRKARIENLVADLRALTPPPPVE